MARIVFFARDTPQNIQRFEYYKQDLEALAALGHELIICTRYAEIPRRFDAMFVWWWSRALVPVLLCRAFGRPCIVTGTFNFRFADGFPGRDYFRRPFWQRWLLRSAARYCTLNLFVSKLELEACSAHFGLENSGYLPHCLHADYLQGPADERRLVLFNLAWSGRENLVRKGIPELLAALRILGDRGVVVRADLAGLAGDGLEELRETIQRLDLADVVTHLGELERGEKIQMLREHEVYVQPSHFEGFGLATLEAMGSGACVIVTDVGAVREVVGDCGLYVSPGSPDELASAIQRVLEDSEFRRDLQARATKRAREQFGFERKVERLKEALARVGVA